MSDDLRSQVLAAARSRANLAYRLDPPPDGRTTTDCSLLIADSAREAGVPLPPGVRTAEQIRQACVQISQDDVKPGDLLFFEGTYDAAGPAGPDGKIASHIGFSLGRGTGQMIDAHERAGEDVAVTNIRTDYWSPKLFDFRRLPGLVGSSSSTSNDAANQEPLRGIDVAQWQGNPDWSAVAASGVAFAFTKVSQGTGFLNPTFARNWLEMRAAGLVRGAYHFADLETNEPKAEADYFLENIERVGGLAAGDILALDLEDYEGSLSRTPDVGGWALAWLRYVESKTGVTPLLYTGQNVIREQSLGGYPALARYPLWLAAYQESMPAAPAPWVSISVWQHSSTSRVAGIVGDVDLNWFSGTREQLVALGKGGAGAVATKPLRFVQPGDVGDGLLTWMRELGTEPAMPSTFLPLGRSPAVIEECQAMDGSILRWHLPTGQHWRYPAA